MNNAKEYLDQVRLWDTQIKNRLNEIADLHSMAMHITSTLRPDGGSFSGGVSDPVGNAASKVAGMETELKHDIDRLVDSKHAVLNLIDRINDPDESRLLYLKYFKYMIWEEIAVEMGYTYRNVCYIHSRALQSVNKLLEERAKDGQEL